jgi:ferredoxin--NADP+ reductase
VLNPATQQPIVGEYVVGWIKRGPSGVIGTNKPDAVETVRLMLEDAAKGQTLNPASAAIERLLAERQPNYVTFSDWQILDQIEQAHGTQVGRTRIKFSRVEDMLAAVAERKQAARIEPLAGD